MAIPKYLLRILWLAPLTLLISTQSSADDGVRVVASIKPVHSLVSAVMVGVDEPYPVMRNSRSHHMFNMRPSDAAALQEADVIFLIDKTIESALADTIENLAGNSWVVELSGSRGLVRWPFREGGAFEADPHHTHDEEDGHDQYGHGHSHAHEHDGEHTDEHAEARTGNHEDADGENHGAFDLHLWLDPANAQVMVARIADVLSLADPSNATRYDENARELIHRLENLTSEIVAEVAPVRGRPFIVFHDSYRYFEERFGLTAVGSVAIDPQRPPGARRIREIRRLLDELDVVCVFDEPAFDRRLVNTLIEGTPVRVGTLDPMGILVESGPDLYFSLLRDMAKSFRDCLAPSNDG